MHFSHFSEGFPSVPTIVLHDAARRFGCEAALVWAAARGDAEAWRHLLEANAPRVAAYVR